MLSRQLQGRNNLSKKSTTTDEIALLAVIKDLNKQISAHEELRRQIPLAVLQPQVTEALGRVRAALARASLPSTVLPPVLERLKVGSEVTVTMSPPQRGRVLGYAQDPDTKEEARLVLTESGQFVIAKLAELQEAPSSPGPVTSTSLTSGPLPLGPENVTPPASTSSGIRPGDSVDTPMGPGKVLRQHPGGIDQWEVQLAQGPPTFFPAGELKVRTA